MQAKEEIRLQTKLKSKLFFLSKLNTKRDYCYGLSPPASVSTLHRCLNKIVVLSILFAILQFISPSQCGAQVQPWRDGAVQGQAVSREVREIYEKGFEWLIANQGANGGWDSPSNPGLV